MSEFRWLLVAAGILVLVGLFWWTRRQQSGRPLFPRGLMSRREPGLASTQVEPAAGSAVKETAANESHEIAAERIIAVRVAGQQSASFGGEALVLALRECGLRHGKFGIFHRHESQDNARTIFSVASLIEPGSFDLTKLKTEKFPGVTLFLTLPGYGDGVAAFDDMLSTARTLAGKLNGELLDEQGSRLSVQRERYLREEVIRFQHRSNSA